MKTMRRWNEACRPWGGVHGWRVRREELGELGTSAKFGTTSGPCCEAVLGVAWTSKKLQYFSPNRIFYCCPKLNFMVPASLYHILANVFTTREWFYPVQLSRCCCQLVTQTQPDKWMNKLFESGSFNTWPSESPFFSATLSHGR